SAIARRSFASSLYVSFQITYGFPTFLQVFGGLVWILVASTRVHDNMSQGWVMFVSVFCFVISTLLLFLYMCGAHGGKSAWVAVDAFYQVIATIFYLSASVLQAYTTYYMKTGVFKNYQIDIAAVVSKKIVFSVSILPMNR
uniref:Myelin and lymphocyte protein n=1 Tax=Anolis carolinensis TaxID=28377 RepID=A0A803SSX7_ANOCA